MTPALSVALPLYATRAAVPELIGRLRAALDGLDGVELVFVDDGCPERSYEAVAAEDTGELSVLLLRHERNHGQHVAVISALRAASGDVCAVMDADLQDAPEDIPLLLAALVAAPSCGAVAAGRRGRYEGRVRRRTARIFRWSMHALTRGRIPDDAGMFLVMPRATRDRVLGLDDPGVHLVAALGRIGVRVHSVPVLRRPRPAGSTAYAPWKRAVTAARALVVVTPLYPAYRLLRPRPAPVVTRVLSGAPAAVAATIEADR